MGPGTSARTGAEVHWRGLTVCGDQDKLSCLSRALKKGCWALSVDAFPASPLSPLQQCHFYFLSRLHSFELLRGGDGGLPLWDGEAGFHPAI